jgi:hypothetical protein
VKSCAEIIPHIARKKFLVRKFHFLYIKNNCAVHILKVSVCGKSPVMCKHTRPNRPESHTEFTQYDYSYITDKLL